MKKQLYRAKNQEGIWLQGLVIGSLMLHQYVHDEFIQEPIDPTTLGEYVHTRSDGKHLFTGDVFLNEVEEDYGDLRLYSVLVYLPERLCYVLLGIGEYLAHFEQGAELDEGEDYFTPLSDFDKLVYIGTIYDEKFKELSNGPA